MSSGAGPAAQLRRAIVLAAGVRGCLCVCECAQPPAGAGRTIAFDLGGSGAKPPDELRISAGVRSELFLKMNIMGNLRLIILDLRWGTDEPQRREVVPRCPVSGRIGGNGHKSRLARSAPEARRNAILGGGVGLGAPRHPQNFQCDSLGSL